MSDTKEMKNERERSYEYGLPDYLEHDLKEFKKAIETHSSLIVFVIFVFLSIIKTS